MENVVEGNVVRNQDGFCDIEVNGKIIEGVSHCPTGKAVYICIKPEDITLFLIESANIPNKFSGRITSLIASGPLVRVRIDCGFSLIALINRISADELHLETGTAVHASFKAPAVHVIARD